MVLKQLYLKVNQGWLGILATALLLAMALFPFGWLAARWPGFDQIAEFMFGTELAHVVGHLVLFSLVGTAVLNTYPQLVSKVPIYLIVMLSVGFLQEFLQLATFKQRLFMVDELLDISVDLLGAIIALKVLPKTKPAH